MIQQSNKQRTWGKLWGWEGGGWLIWLETHLIYSHPPCSDMGLAESPEHILLICSAYHDTRLNLIAAALHTRNQTSHTLFIKHLFSNEKKMMQFLVDPSSIPEVISCAQSYGSDIYNDIFYIGRTWCFSLHRERSKRLGKWNFRDWPKFTQFWTYSTHCIVNPC